MSLVVGTSGWAYDHWRGDFYPEGLPKAHWFDYYVERFPTVEVNYTFYRLPSDRTISSWRARTPQGFLFALKGSRLITHRLRLRNCDEALSRFHDRVLGLGDRLGVILWQLPPDLIRDAGVLDDFLEKLPSDVPAAIEFRHESWHHVAIHRVLRRHEAALVWVSSESLSPDLATTAGFVYARFHGLSGGYAHDYTREQLAPWVTHLKGEDGYAFFNNDAAGRAPENAVLLANLLAT
jgi:uncharacterized protein YecE (DUF72 family)